MIRGCGRWLGSSHFFVCLLVSCFVFPVSVALFIADACAFVSGRSQQKVEAFVIMVAATKLLKEYATADQLTYGTILRCCSTLLPPGDTRREELVANVFQKACDEGLVGHLVLKQLRFAASGTQYQDLIGYTIEDPPRIRDLPVAWTCNVREKRRPRQQMK